MRNLGVFLVLVLSACGREPSAESQWVGLYDVTVDEEHWGCADPGAPPDVYSGENVWDVRAGGSTGLYLAGMTCTFPLVAVDATFANFVEQSCAIVAGGRTGTATVTGGALSLDVDGFLAGDQNVRVQMDDGECIVIHGSISGWRR